MEAEKLKMQTRDGVADNISWIAERFPNCVTEKKDAATGEVKLAVDFDMLRQELSSEVVEGKDERYQFVWPDKKKAILLANAPINATLRPCVEESVDFENTQNLYIEGDNLDVLKCLKETYLGKVKMIYIDPPYNTGNDFVYNDDFAESVEEYLANSGQYDEQGNRLVANTESNGRFHTDWLNMIYPRLKVARDLLAHDGSIFISIDDREAENLIKVCDEIFGESCFVANIGWQKNYSPRNDSKGIPAEKESIVIYGKNAGWTPKKLPRTSDMNRMYGNPDNDPKGDWRNDNAFASDAKTHQGMVYAIQHPFTGELIYPYNNGHWRYSQQEMLSHMNGWCEYELSEIDDAHRRAEICGVDVDDVRKGVKAIILKEPLDVSKKKALFVLKRGQWPKFYFTKFGEGGIGRKTYLSDVEGKMVTNLWPHTEVGHTDEAKKELKTLFEGDIPFDTPKPVRLMDRIVQIATDKESIILDFFSGSATTAHAVLLHNSKDNGKRKFILVQIPENVDNKYGNLCEIGKERIRRAAKKIKEETGADIDYGFRVLKLDSTNMEDVYYAPSEVNQGQMTLFADNVKPGRTSEDLLFQTMLELGATLDSKIEKMEVNDKNVYNVADGYLVACFDTEVTDDVVKAIAKMQPQYAVLRDSSLADDSTATNFEQIFKTYSPTTTCKIL